MQRGWPGRAVRVLLAVVTAVGALWLTPWTGPTPAQAAPPKAYVSVSMDAMSPALPARDGTVRLRGRVTNTSEVELTNLQATFWRSLDPIENPEAMTKALASEADDPLGKRVQPLTTFEPIPSKADRTLAPQESTDFDLKVDVADLELLPTDAVYLIGIHVLGQLEGVGADFTLGRGRIFMPLVASPPRNALRTTGVVVLTSRPSLVRDGVLLDDHLAGEVAAGGRLSKLLATAEQDEVSFLVDPALVEELETMRGGYQVLGVDGTSTADGTGRAAATAWLQEFTGVLRDGDGYRLPYGNPDVAALVHAGQQGVLEQAAAQGEQVSTTRRLPLVVLPARGRADTETLAAAESLRPRAILLSDRSTGATAPLLAGPGSAPVVSFTAEGFGGGPGPAPRNTAVKVRQRMLADTWIEASSTPADGTVGRVRLVTEAEQAAGADTELDVPWIKSSTLAELLDRMPSRWTGELGYGPGAREAEIGPDQLVAVREVAESYRTLADLLVTPATARAEGRQAVPRIASADWRYEPDVGREYAAVVRRRISTQVASGVSLQVVGQVVTTGRTGSFPVTVRNSLPAGTDPAEPDLNAVDVRVRFASANGQRLTVASLDELAPVPGGGSLTENAQVEAQTNGTVRVMARLYTRTGQPIGRSVPIDVTATQAGTTGWLIAIVAGVVLIGTTALRIRQVAKARGEASATEDPLPVSRPPESARPGLDPTTPRNGTGAVDDTGHPPADDPADPVGPAQHSTEERLDV